MSSEYCIKHGHYDGGKNLHTILPCPKCWVPIESELKHAPSCGLNLSVDHPVHGICTCCFDSRQAVEQVLAELADLKKYFRERNSDTQDALADWEDARAD